MTTKPKLMDEFNPLVPGLTDEQLLVMFIKAGEKGVMETFRRMPLEKQKKFINLKDPHPGNAARTALIEASMAGKKEVVAHLLALGPDLEIKDKQGWTALAGAAWKGDTESVRLLLDAGAKIDAGDDENFTPLHDAINGGNPETALLLIERGANPLIKNGDGMSALDIARDVKMRLVIPALETAMARYNTEAVVKAMGHTVREIEAPSPATFRRKHAPSP